jgi:hypothetical protein
VRPRANSAATNSAATNSAATNSAATVATETTGIEAIATIQTSENRTICSTTQNESSSNPRGHERTSKAEILHLIIERVNGELCFRHEGSNNFTLATREVETRQALRVRGFDRDQVKEIMTPIVTDVGLNKSLRNAVVTRGLVVAVLARARLVTTTAADRDRHGHQQAHSRSQSNEMGHARMFEAPRRRVERMMRKEPGRQRPQC